MKTPVASISLEAVPQARFAALLQAPFRVLGEAGRDVLLTLVAATAPRYSPAAASGGDGPGYETFSLIFEGPADHPLPQQIHRCEQEQLGRFDLFIVPIGLEAGRLRYEAVFNRLRLDTSAKRDSLSE
jgi:hypothetical protein